MTFLSLCLSIVVSYVSSFAVVFGGFHPYICLFLFKKHFCELYIYRLLGTKEQMHHSTVASGYSFDSSDI